MTASGTGAKPGALTHGLTSRWLLEAVSDDIDELAGLLTGSSAGEPAVEDAARRAAEAILGLRQVRSMKIHALSHADPERKRIDPREAFKAFGSMSKILSSARKAKPKKVGTADDLAMLEFIDTSANILERLDAYERRALSRRSKAIRELDFARIEAARRKAG